MSVWIEIHCDVRAPAGLEPDPRTGFERYVGCETNDNENPAAMAANTQEAIRHVLRTVQAMARERLWVYRDGRWACPYCQRIIE